MADVIHKELSYHIVGAVFRAFNQLGYGYREKVYQKAIAAELKKDGLKLQAEIRIPLYYDGNKIGIYQLDLLIEDKLIIEIKVGNRFYVKDLQQILGYLKSTGLRLGILVLVTKRGIRYRRIVN